MNNENELQLPVVYVVSDSVGETGEFVVRAAASQFEPGNVEIRRVPYIDDEGTIEETVLSAKEVNGTIAFTLVIPRLKEYMLKRVREENIPHVDIMTPILDTLGHALNREPKGKPGLVHQLDEEYFRKVEAIEFAVKYDDARDPRGLLKADVVLVGVSRTSKTPLSMYLAHKRMKVANVPLVPEVKAPDELFIVPSTKVIGLTISPDQLGGIRKERLKSLGLTSSANYANMERILLELDYAEGIMKRLGCPVIDVSNKAVEETAGLIIELFRKGGKGI
jgi:regulator of PEP synthase PpsR (kinase-PPPase family)